MTNNYIKVARYTTDGDRARVASQTFEFDDRDDGATATAYARALSLAVGDTLSVFRPVAGVDLPVIGALAEAAS